jgi:hypothetical protein
MPVALSKNVTPQPSHAIVVRVELIPAAKRQTVAIADQFGMTQIATLSRLIEWFAGQSEEVQDAILGQPPTVGGGDVALHVLSRMAKREPSCGGRA